VVVNFIKYFMESSSLDEPILMGKSLYDDIQILSPYAIESRSHGARADLSFVE